MDLLKAELEKKKQRTSELVAKAGGERGGRRFVRRGEAARLEKEERLKNQADLIRWVMQRGVWLCEGEPIRSGGIPRVRLCPGLAGGDCEQGRNADESPVRCLVSLAGAL